MIWLYIAIGWLVLGVFGAAIWTCLKIGADYQKMRDEDDEQ